MNEDWPEQPRVLGHLGAPPAGHQHDLHLGPQARLHRPHAVDADPALAVVQQRGAAAEQRAVEVEVQAARRSETLTSSARAPTQRRALARAPRRAACSRPSCAHAPRDRRRAPSTPSGSSADSGWWRLRCSSRSTWAMPPRPTSPPDVDQHRDLDAVAGGEGEPLEQLAPGGDLAGERLADRRRARGRTARAPAGPSDG